MGGILTGLTPAPFNAWGLAWIGLVPLWLVVFHSQKSRKKIIFSALAWGFGYQGLALFWITGVHPMTWMGVPWLASIAIAIFCWLFITFWGTAIVVTWAIGINFFKQIISKKINKINPVFNILLGVALWCSLETLWSHTPLWWSPLAYTQSPYNLVILQLGKLSGFSTVTAAIVLVNALLAEVIVYLKNNYKRSIILLGLPLGLCLSFHLMGLWMYNLPLKDLEQNAIEVGIIQGNIPNKIKLYAAGWRKALEGYTKGYLKLVNKGVDVVLTPETALPFYWQNIINSSNSFYQAVLAKKIPAWVGAWGKNNNSFTNSLFTLTGDGETYSRYNKYKLVPLGEYIPFESVLGGIVDRLSPLEAHQAAGEPDQIFDTPFGRVIVSICYESAFPQHFRRQAAEGGKFIISSANNAHYSKSMPAQHHALDVMRAIETDRWVARATNTGYSAIIDPRGRTLWISQIDRYEIYAGTIYPRDTKTLYVRWGDWLTPLFWLLVIACWLFVFDN
ncbi:MAG: apolipoprotein N-acyltransferase [Xenococcaceae cyanobacterium]